MRMPPQALCVCVCVRACVPVLAHRLSGARGWGPVKLGERGEQPLGSPSESLVTGVQTQPQLAPPLTILAFLPLSGTQSVNSNSLLMNWSPKVARQAHLLNAHTLETKHTYTQWRDYIALHHISVLSRTTVQLDSTAC